MRKKSKNRNEKGFILVLVVALVAIFMLMMTAVFSAGIQGDFQGLGGTTGDGTSSGGVISAGDDGCYLDTTLDLSTAQVRNVEGQVTGYYSPREGQQKYATGNYADDKRLNAPNDPHTKSGIDVAKGAIAVDPKVYPFGTVFEIPGYGRGIAVDTGGGVGSTHLDAWAGIGDKGLTDAYILGNKIRVYKVYSWPGLSDAELFKSIKRVCSPAMASGGKGCPAIASNAANIGSQLEKKNFSTYDYLPGVTPENYTRASRYWCTNLVIDSYKQAGFKITTSLSAAAMASWFRDNASYFDNGTATPRPGDFMDMNQNGGSGHHVGVVVSVDASCLYSSEANSLSKYPKKYCLNNGKYTRGGSEIFGFARLKNCQ